MLTPTNIGGDFDVGGQVVGRLNVVSASSGALGKVRLAAPAHIAARDFLNDNIVCFG